MELKVPWTAGAMGWERSNQRKIRSALVRERGWPNPVHRARIYEEALERLGSYGRVGREFGVSRIEVCHYVTLVKRLPPDIVTFVEQLGDPMQDRRYTLRALLKIARLPTANEKRGAFKRLRDQRPPRRKSRPGRSDSPSPATAA
jgi:hypothetical protein